MAYPRVLARLCLCVILITGAITLILSGGHPYRAELESLSARVPDGGAVKLTARVTDKIQSRDGITLVLQVKELTHRGLRCRARKLYVFEQGESALTIGDRVLAGGEIRYFEAARNPGNFDRRFYYGVRGVDARFKPAYLKVLREARFPLREHLFMACSRAHERITETMGEEGTVLSAMLLGKKSLIDQDTRRLYQKNGIAHLLAISGLHLSLLGFGLYQLLRRSGMPYLPRLLLMALTLALYMSVTGFSVSIYRAAVMLMIRVICDGTGRAYDGFLSLLIAVVLILMRSPWYLWDASLQLSVSAVCALLMIRKPYEWNGPPGWRETLAESLRASALIFAVALPVTLWHFFEVSPYGILLNLIVIPLMPVAMIAGGAGMITAMIPVAGGWICRPFQLAAKLVLMINAGLCRLAGTLPFHRICAGRPPAVLILIYYAALIAAFIVRRRGKRLFAAAQRVWPLCLLGAALLGILVYYPVRHLIRRDTEIVMLDIGQGDCLYVDDGAGTRYLIDGGSSSVERVYAQRIEPFLLGQGITRLDAVFASHGDADHISAFSEIFAERRPSVRVGALVTGEKAYRDEMLDDLIRAAREAGVRTVTMGEDDRIRTRTLTLRCLGPPVYREGESGLPEPGNEASLVLLLTRGSFRMLFTGDAEGDGERALTRRMGEEQPLTVLKVAHHGSKNSSDTTFLEQADPRIALISAGRNNLYGHPHEETLERIRAAGSRIYRTDEQGAVTIRTDGRECIVKPLFH